MFLFLFISVHKVPTVNVEGQCYPVAEHFLDEISRAIGWRSLASLDDDPDAKADLVASVVAHLTTATPSGAILVFLPGWDEIMTVLDLLAGKLRKSEVSCSPRGHGPVPVPPPHYVHLDDAPAMIYSLGLQLYLK